MSRRAGLPWSLLRQIGLILAVGLGLLATTLLSGLAGASASFLGGRPPDRHGGGVAAAERGRVLARVPAGRATRDQGPADAAERGVVRDRLADPPAARHLPGLTPGVQELVGVRRVRGGHRLAGLALPAGQFTLYAVEANVVGVLRLWPRSLAPPPLTAEDRRAYTMLRADQERRPEQEVESRITEEPDGSAKDGPPKDRCARSQHV